MLTDKIHVQYAHDADSPEDILASSLGSLFPDETRNQHGDPDATITYKSEKFGNITLTIADPSSENNRKLFAHYLWNASIYLSDAISESDGIHWNVKEERVLELGAGLGLCGIMSALLGASEVMISDYPANELLKNLEGNVKANIPKETTKEPVVIGHEWGVFKDEFSQSHKHHFTRILAADCLWMPQEHENIMKSIDHFLAETSTSEAFVTAGFHTGRAKVAHFFDVAESSGFQVFLEEVDVDGQKRSWQKERSGGREDVNERKRWLVVATLKRSKL